MTSASGGTLQHKLFVRLVLPIALITFVNAIDRVNISFAGPAMMRELRLDPQQFGLAVSAFFVAYLLFQYPHAALLRLIGIRLWLLASMLLWGVSGLWMSQVDSAAELYAARFLLGVAEAGFAPGMTWFISRWVPMSGRGKAMAGALSAVPLSMVLGGPLCGWMLGMDNPLGWSPWRWMFLVQAIPNVLLAIAAALYFVDEPRQARWLNATERHELERQHERDTPAAPSASFRAIARDIALWRCALAWLFTMTGAYALVFWLPQLVRQLDVGRGELAIASISALPQLGMVIGLLGNGWLSDRAQERLWHAAIPIGLAGLAMIASVLLPTGWPVLLLLVVAGLGIGAAQGVFWTIPAVLGVGGGSVPVGAIALISMFGTAGGVIGPMLIGAVRQQTGSFMPAIAALAVLLVLAFFVLAPWRRPLPLLHPASDGPAR